MFSRLHNKKNERPKYDVPPQYVVLRPFVEDDEAPRALPQGDAVPAVDVQTYPERIFRINVVVHGRQVQAIKWYGGAIDVRAGDIVRVGQGPYNAPFDYVIGTSDSATTIARACARGVAVRERALATASNEVHKMIQGLNETYDDMARDEARRSKDDERRALYDNAVVALGSEMADKQQE